MTQSNVIPKEKQTAWERWEMTSFPGDRGAAHGVNLPTAQQLEDIQRQARKEGFDAGYRDGTARAQTEAAKLVSVLTALDRDLAQLDEQLADKVLSLALTVARSMLLTALEVQPEMLLPILREALAEIPAQSTHKRIHLHPEDAKLVRMHASELLSAGAWQVIDDVKVSRGGCRVRTDHGEVDATLETRWLRALASIGRDDAWLARPAAAESADD